MRVSQEIFTVLPDSTLHEVSVLLSGMRITFTSEEARDLAGELSKCAQHLGPFRKSHNDATRPTEGDSREFSSELRAVKEEMKRNPGVPRTG
jgi:hypothetical protein